MARPSIGTAMAIVAATLVALAAIGFLVAASGIYNVAASKPHFDIVRGLLQFVLNRSVATHSWFVPAAPELNDPDLVNLGAGHFLRGCAFCHGAPGERGNPAVRSMQPHPPDLSHGAATWSDRELFWIVKNGFKYTGMPSWPAARRGDEVWAVVAFLRRLPDMQPETYREMVTGAAKGTSQDAIRRGEPIADFPVSECTRCHGDAEIPPVSRLVPKLAGQSEAYLVHALDDYAQRRRASGIMEMLANPLEPELRRQLASYFAGMKTAARTASHADEQQIERGRAIALEGVAPRGIPACIACHSGRAAASFPLLSGQPAPYLALQLRLFREGARAGTAQGAVMTAIAERLSGEQIEDVAAYFENRSPGEDRRTAITTGAGR